MPWQPELQRRLAVLQSSSLKANKCYTAPGLCAQGPEPYFEFFSKVATKEEKSVPF